MTPAEAGDTKTHEKYIRLPNNFDYQSFFQQEGITNGSVIQVDFEAMYNGNSKDLIPLKFVFINLKLFLFDLDNLIYHYQN